jgi:hypothetical protein
VQIFNQIKKKQFLYLNLITIFKQHFAIKIFNLLKGKNGEEVFAQRGDGIA